MHINYIVNLEIIDDSAKVIKAGAHKPFVLIDCQDVYGQKVTIALTTNIGEMIGGACAGTSQRFESSKESN